MDFVTKKLNTLIKKILHFISISVKCIRWHIFNENVENQYLYRNKEDLRFFQNKKFLYFDLKDFIFSK